jgi:hypothetical protein
MEAKVNCSWTICRYCKNINNRIGQGECKHPNGSKNLIDENILGVIEHDNQGTMIRCNAYSGIDS